MDRKEKQTLMKAINYKNYAAVDNKKPITEKPTKEKPITEKQKNMNFDLRVMERNKALNNLNRYDSEESIVSKERLQEAIIWSEILGKPLCKRGKRR